LLYFPSDVAIDIYILVVHACSLIASLKLNWPYMLVPQLFIAALFQLYFCVESLPCKALYITTVCTLKHLLLHQFLWL